MTFFDLTLKQACSAFSIELDWLRKVVIYSGPIGHTRYGGKVQRITSADLAAYLAQLQNEK